MNSKALMMSLLVILSLGITLSCHKKSKDDDKTPGVGSADGTPAEYADAEKWLCLPGRTDPCSTDPDTSEMLADGTFKPADPAVNPDDSVDCFYVHPSSDLALTPGNTESPESLSDTQQLTIMQAAPFRSACRIFAPLYHQVTIGTYALSEEDRKPYINAAAADIQNAFNFYMTNYNNGRKIVLIGHSQGSEMLSILMQAKFDQDPAMRAQLLLAIIPGFVIHTPIGKTVGGTFTNIPTCTSAGQVGCVISYQSYQAGTVYLGDGSITLLSTDEQVCVNPATLDNTALTDDDRPAAKAPLTGTLFPPSSWVSDSIREVASPTQFIRVDTVYNAACDHGPDPRNRYLAIDENLPDTDPRHGLVNLDADALKTPKGLHILDMQFPMAELVSLVRARR